MGAELLVSHNSTLLIGCFEPVSEALCPARILAGAILTIFQVAAANPMI